MVTRHGKPAVVVMSAASYKKKSKATKALQSRTPYTKQAKKMSNKKKTKKAPEMSFIEFLLAAPKMPDEWFANGADPFERIQGNMREVDWD